MNQHRPDIGFNLTETERKILALLVNGSSNAEISKQLYISTSTVKYHLTNIFTKLGAKNRVEAATIAVENGLVQKQN